MKVIAASSSPNDIHVYSNTQRRGGGILTLLLGMVIGVAVSRVLLLAGNRSCLSDGVQENVDFHFQMLNISTPRQGGWEAVPLRPAPKGMWPLKTS
mgnify:CR=1 FL=1